MPCSACPTAPRPPHDIPDPKVKKKPCSLDIVNISSAKRSAVCTDFTPAIDQSAYEAWQSAKTIV
jgi:hypothetical protein